MYRGEDFCLGILRVVLAVTVIFAGDNAPETPEKIVKSPRAFIKRVIEPVNDLLFATRCE